MKKKQSNKNVNQIISLFRYSGIYLLLTMCIALLLSFVLFYFKISITRFNLIGSLILSTIIMFVFNKKFNLSKKKLVGSIIIAIIVLIVFMLIQTFVFDRSSDGNTYHKDAIGNLFEGWNPVYESSKTFVQKNLKLDNYNMHNYDIWKDHYAKANWVIEACFYKTTGNIETGKTVNLVFMYILFTLSLSYLSIKIGNKAYIIALLLAFNPITCNQLFTFYNDQLGASILFSLIITLLEILDVSYKKDNFEGFSILFLIFIIAVNIKFNIMGYALLFTFLFMLRYLYLKYKEKKGLSTLKKLLIYYIVLFFVSFVIVGYSTYITNFVDHGSMFYPLYGDNTEDIITAQQPKSFVKKNSIDKFFIGTFSEVNNLQTTKQYKLKIPFTFKKQELKESMSIDTRISGYGLWFSGILLISLIVLLFYLKKKKLDNEKISIIMITLITISIIIMISESWWARYNPTTYIFSIISAYLLLKYNKKKYLNYIFIILIVINNGIILLGNTYYSVKESYSINKQLVSLKDKTIEMDFNLGDMTGILYNLNDYNINYKIVNSTKKFTNITYYKYLKFKVKEDHNE